MDLLIIFRKLEDQELITTYTIIQVVKTSDQIFTR